MQRYTVYLYLEIALHDSGGTSTHHQERIQLYLQHLVFVTPLLLSAAIVEELEPVWVCCGWRAYMLFYLYRMRWLFRQLTLALKGRNWKRAQSEFKMFRESKTRPQSGWYSNVYSVSNSRSVLLHGKPRKRWEKQRFSYSEFLNFTYILLKCDTGNTKSEGLQ
jgi:hypothetical protein